MNQNGFPTPKIKTGFDFDNDMVGFVSVNLMNAALVKKFNKFHLLSILHTKLLGRHMFSFTALGNLILSQAVPVPHWNCGIVYLFYCWNYLICSQRNSHSKFEYGLSLSEEWLSLFPLKSSSFHCLSLELKFNVFLRHETALHYPSISIPGSLEQSWMCQQRCRDSPPRRDT